MGSLFIDELYGFRDLLRCFSGFFIGCLTAALAALVERNLAYSKCPTWLAPICFLAIGIFLEFKHNKNTHYDPIIFVLISGLILALMFSADNWFKRILLTRPLLWLGEISYSLYMAQLVCIFFCEGVLRGLHRHISFYRQAEDFTHIYLAYPVTLVDGLCKYGFFLVVLLTVSSLSFYLIEKPCRQASRKWIHRPKLIAP